jgi:hypothetical protein
MKISSPASGPLKVDDWPRQRRPTIAEEMYAIRTGIMRLYNNHILVSVEHAERIWH